MTKNLHWLSLKILSFVRIIRKIYRFVGCDSYDFFHLLLISHYFWNWRHMTVWRSTCENISNSILVQVYFTFDFWIRKKKRESVFVCLKWLIDFDYYCLLFSCSNSYFFNFRWQHIFQAMCYTNYIFQLLDKNCEHCHNLSVFCFTYNMIHCWWQ